MLLFFLVLGLAIGSFINVLAYRLRIAESIMGRSFCPHCRNRIAWYDNVPLVSFVLLRFRCRHCRKRISWQYPIVEALTGAAFALVGWRFFRMDDFQTWFLAAYQLVMAGSLIAILVYDVLYMEIPSVVLWPAIVVALAFGFVSDLETGTLADFSGGLMLQGLAAAAVAFAFFFSLSEFSKEKWMGKGDAYLAILIGLVAGWPGIFMALFLAFSIGAICGIILMTIGKKGMKSQIPFAPFLVIGTLAAVIFYHPAVDWYFRIIGF